MAFSSTTASIPFINPHHPSTCCYSSSNLSSLQFPLPNRRLNYTGNGRLILSTPQRRHTFRVEAKKQSFSSFDDLLANADKPVLVDFYATWCGPCQFMAPVLDEVSSKLIDKIQVVKIDTEKYPKIANQYKIEALPTFIIFKDGVPCDRFEGALPAPKLIERIESTLSVKQ